jgi:hypothetical protein
MEAKLIKFAENICRGIRIGVSVGLEENCCCFDVFFNVIRVWVCEIVVNQLY